MERNSLQLFADFNLCGPSINASNHCKAGYTTDSGITKPHLQSFHAFSDQPKADINYLVKSDDVQVIGVSLAMDGTALKPGLEFDIRQLCLRIMSGIMSPTTLFRILKKLKKDLITSVGVAFMTSVDNSSTMPVGVHYHPKSVYLVKRRCRRCLG